jgi:hypothetical protein
MLSFEVLSLKERDFDHSRETLILERQDGMVWVRLIWLRIGTSGGLL